MIQFKVVRYCDILVATNFDYITCVKSGDYFYDLIAVFKGNEYLGYGIGLPDTAMSITLKHWKYVAEVQSVLEPVFIEEETRKWYNVPPGTMIEKDCTGEGPTEFKVTKVDPVTLDVFGLAPLGTDEVEIHTNLRYCKYRGVRLASVLECKWSN